VIQQQGLRTRDGSGGEADAFRDVRAIEIRPSANLDVAP
jgi:hypothetical protein